MFPLDDTIAAIASPPGGAAHGIVRISGPHAIECVADLFHQQTACGFARTTSEQALPETHPRVIPGSLHLPELHSPLPCDVYLWCGRPACLSEPPTPQVRSYTGQPVAEIHTLGSPPLLQMILRALCAAGARLAGPGEFTLRAFLAGRIDLTQAEAVLGIIDADDGPTLTAALSQLAGGLARPLHRLRDDLLDLLAHVEAGFDFADEDLPFVTPEELDARLAQAKTLVAAIERQMKSRAEPIDVVRAVLLGRPNTGKSSLFNALADNAAALVSHHAGTTRDYLTANLDLDGIKCRLIDTAGTANNPLAVSPVADAIEHAAQLATETQRRSADVQILCLDSTRPLDDWERNELHEATVVVLTKCDAARTLDLAASGIETSSLTGAGIEMLRNHLRQRILAAAGSHGDVVACTAARCRESLHLAAQSLQRSRAVAQNNQEELVAAEIRVALDEIGHVVGAVYTDDILDRIFTRFCIGK